MTRATDVWFSNSMLYLRLEDGREIVVPLKWFPKLHKASDEQRDSWRLIGNGIGVHWKALDEDLSVQALLVSLFAPPRIALKPATPIESVESNLDPRGS